MSERISLPTLAAIHQPVCLHDMATNASHDRHAIIKRALQFPVASVTVFANVDSFLIGMPEDLACDPSLGGAQRLQRGVVRRLRQELATPFIPGRKQLLGTLRRDFTDK